MSTYVKENQTLEYDEIINQETGEVQYQIKSQTINSTKFYKTREEFIQIYLEDMSGLLSLTTKTELKILMVLWKYSSYNEEDKGNCITVTPKVINDLVKATNVQEQSVRNAITTLLKNPNQLLIKDPKFRSTYYLNPKYFFKGSLKDRPKVMSVVLNYVEKNTEPNEFDV